MNEALVANPAWVLSKERRNDVLARVEKAARDDIFRWNLSPETLYADIIQVILKNLDAMRLSEGSTPLHRLHEGLLKLHALVTANTGTVAFYFVESIRCALRDMEELKLRYDILEQLKPAKESIEKLMNLVGNKKWTLHDLPGLLQISKDANNSVHAALSKT